MKLDQAFLQRKIFNFLNNTTGINETDLNNSIGIFPNPTTSIINISTSLTNFELKVFDINGQLVLNDRNRHTIDVSNFPTGLYVIRLQDLNTKSIITKKFIRE